MIPKRVKDLTGKKFGKLTVTGFSHVDRGAAHFAVSCDCGNQKIVKGYSLTRSSSPTKSCGCLNTGGIVRSTDRAVETITKHGKTGTPIYITWRNMIRRCTDPNHESFSRYGGAGITVDPSWMEFENFYRDMGDKPSPKHSLDRIDNSLGYGPDNCRWATIKEQARNMSTNRLIEFKGHAKPLIEWAEEVGLNRTTIKDRLVRLGWPIEAALSLPKGSRIADHGYTSLEVTPAVKDREYARSRVREAIQKGTLTKPPYCQSPRCRIKKTEAHHWLGYAHEHHLDVIFLCRRHHEIAEKIRVKHHPD